MNRSTATRNHHKNYKKTNTYTQSLTHSYTKRARHSHIHREKHKAYKTQTHFFDIYNIILVIKNIYVV